MAMAEMMGFAVERVRMTKAKAIEMMIPFIAPDTSLFCVFRKTQADLELDSEPIVKKFATPAGADAAASSLHVSHLNFSCSSIVFDWYHRGIVEFTMTDAKMISPVVSSTVTLSS